MSSSFFLILFVTVATYLFVLTHGAPSDTPAVPKALPALKSDAWFSEARHALNWAHDAHCRQLMRSFDAAGAVPWSRLRASLQMAAISCLMSHPLVQQKPALESQLRHCNAALSAFTLAWWQRADTQAQSDLIRCLYDRLKTHRYAEHYVSEWYPLGGDQPPMLVWLRKEKT